MSASQAEVRRARPDDVAAILPHLRRADIDEIQALNMEPARAVEQSLRTSERAWTAEFDGAVSILGGVTTVSHLGGVGMPWLVATDAVEANRRTFLEWSQVFVPQVCVGYCVLRNIVDARNTRAVRWLKWAGFKFDEPFRHAVTGVPFYPFWMEGSLCA